MFKKNFEFIVLCVLLLLASRIGWPIPLRVAVAANALIILLGAVQKARDIYARKKAKD